MSLGDFIWGILKGIGLGTVCGLRGEKLARFTFFIPIVESIAGQKLEDALAEWIREQQRREFEKKIAEIQKSLQSAFQTHMGNRSEEGETWSHYSRSSRQIPGKMANGFRSLLILR